jgi:hypothetical protein
VTRTNYITPEGAAAEACCIADLVDVADVDGARWTCPGCGRHWRCVFEPATAFDEPTFDWLADE